MIRRFLSKLRKTPVFDLKYKPENWSLAEWTYYYERTGYQIIDSSDKKILDKTKPILNRNKNKTRSYAKTTV